jgi:TrmH family RNA methyltransferase
MPVEITSRKNDLVKEILHLSDSAAYRREKRMFAAEGARLCSDAARSGLRIDSLLYTGRAGEKYGSYLDAIRKASPAEYLVSQPVAAYLSGTRSPQGVFCVCAMPETGRPLPAAAKTLLVLEDMQDPANMGAVLRTAEALGIDGVLLCGSCCDAYSPKALRASMGAVFRVPLLRSDDAPAAVRRLNEAGFTTLAAVPDPSAVPVTSLRRGRPTAAVVGNEGSGLTRETQRACSVRVTIPMRGRAESLNAAASAAILMWEMTRAEAGGEGL